MNSRRIFVGATLLILSAATVSAQGAPVQKVVLSKAVLKSLGAHKSKSKTPLTARVGMIPRSSAAAAKSQIAAPTWVREVKPISGRK